MAIEDSRLTRNEVVNSGWVQRLNKAAQDFWIGARREGDPQIKFNILLTTHNTAKDIKPIKDNFPACDIYLFEAIGWNPDAEDICAMVSNGLLNPKKFAEELMRTDKKLKDSASFGFSLAQLEMIYKSGKIVSPVDLPAGHPSVAKEEMARNILYTQLANSKKVEEKIELARKLCIQYAREDEERELLIMEQIPQKISRFLSRWPELRKKPTLNVLISVGAVHTPISIMAKSAQPDSVTRQFHQLPFSHLFSYQGGRAVRFGKDPDSLSPELLARMALELEFFNTFKKSTKQISDKSGSQFMNDLAHGYVSRFSLEDIRQFYEEVAKGRKFRDVFLGSLKKKGVEKSPLYT